jgi:hypothetical protein
VKASSPGSQRADPNSILSPTSVNSATTVSRFHSSLSGELFVPFFLPEQLHRMAQPCNPYSLELVTRGAAPRAAVHLRSRALVDSFAEASSTPPSMTESFPKDPWSSPTTGTYTSSATLSQCRHQVSSSATTHRRPPKVSVGARGPHHGACHALLIPPSRTAPPPAIGNASPVRAPPWALAPPPRTVTPR